MFPSHDNPFELEGDAEGALIQLNQDELALCDENPFAEQPLAEENPLPPGPPLLSETLSEVFNGLQKVTFSDALDEEPKRASSGSILSTLTREVKEEDSDSESEYENTYSTTGARYRKNKVAYDIGTIEPSSGQLEELTSDGDAIQSEAQMRAKLHKRSAAPVRALAAVFFGFN